MKYRVCDMVTDFDGEPQRESVVCIKDAQMHDVYLTYTDSDGNYSIDVEEGEYVAISGVKDYIQSKLEYWGWDLSVHHDMTVNMTIDGIEVYAVNAFLLQRSINKSSLMVYFRPMSLHYYKENISLFNDPNVNNMNIMPPLTIDDICVTINGVKSEILEMSKVSERATDEGFENKFLYGYLVQIEKDGIDPSKSFQKIEIVVSSDETKEKGAGCLFWKAPKAYFDA